jgi:hypothetical protein
LTFAASLLMACGGEQSDSQPAPAPGADAPAGAPAAVPPVADAWLTELPSDFPADVPRYPGASVSKARSSMEGGVVADFATDDDPAKVASYFADSFAAQGWSTQSAEAPDGRMIFADKGERSATISVTSAEGKTKIELLVVEMR